MEKFTQPELVNRLMQYLDSVKERPPMWGINNTDTLMAFLAGIGITYQLIGLTELIGKSELVREVAEAHGYIYSAAHPMREMEEQGYATDRIIRESIELEIAILARWLNLTSA